MIKSTPMVRMNDFTREPVVLTAALKECFRKVLDSGHYVLGENVAEFEKLFAARSGVEFAVGVGNGLDAIEIGLRAVGIGPGDEVITTPMTAVATVIGVLRAGAVPVLADIDPESGLIDLSSVERCMTPRTRAVLLVHLYGQIRDIDRWISFCSSRGIVLLEDCAQAHDASDNGRAAGSMGIFGAYSFYPTKNLGAVGDAGAVVTSDPVVAEFARKYRNYGQSTRYVHDIEGSNSRLDELQASLLVERLRWLEEFTIRRKEIAGRYMREILNPTVSLLAPPANASNHVYHLFVVKVRERESLAHHLRENGIESLVHYPIPIHHQQPYLGMSRDPMGLQEAERFSQECLSIPCAPHLTEDEVTRVIDTINTFRAR